MIYSDFHNEKLSLLGFGTMRLPLTSSSPDSPVDEAQVAEMVDYAISHGVNYFDTAYPYHGGQSERIIGRALKKYPREQFYLATKYPGHQISTSYNPAAVFEDQLKKCGVDFFDFYLLHNVYENSIKTYCDPRWGIVEYFAEQKKKGRIHYLGFSCHGRVDNLREFLDRYGDQMDFCQIQLNYLDWTLQNAKEKYELLTQRNIPVWVMEPVRGGRLAELSDADDVRLKEKRPQESTAAWAFRFLQGLPNVQMILSGMSNMEQMQDNVQTFDKRNPLTDMEQALLLEIAEGMKNSIPCTACRYCCDGYPQALDIPMLLSTYNELLFAPNVNIGMRVEALAEDKRPSACIGCGKCAKICPQKIDIPAAMRTFTEELAKLPSWAEICRMRERAQNEGEVMFMLLSKAGIISAILALAMISPVLSGCKGAEQNSASEDKENTMVEFENLPVYEYGQREITVSNDGQNIYGIAYIPETEQAQVPLVICAHGLGGSYRDCMDYAQQLASHGLAAYCFDFRGGGGRKSDGSTTEMSVMTEASDMEAILADAKTWDFVDADRIAFLGASQGGIASAIAAARHTDEVAGLILMYPAFLVSDAVHELYDSPDEVPESFFFNWITVGRPYVVDMWDYDVYEEIGNYTKKVLLLHGNRDGIVPISYSERAAEVYPDVSYYVIKNGGHGFYGKTYDESVTRIFEYLQEIELLKQA